jgi:hypothetical protein
MSDSYNDAQKKVEAENQRLYQQSVDHVHKQQRGW